MLRGFEPLLFGAVNDECEQCSGDVEAVLARQWTDNRQGSAKRRSELAIHPSFPFSQSTANSAQNFTVLIPIHRR